VYWVLGTCFALGAGLNLTLLFFPAESSPLRYLAIGCVQGLVAGWLISSGNDAARRARQVGPASAARPPS
jgi:hypothetical protein